jgi:hypothetical protein
MTFRLTADEHALIGVWVGVWVFARNRPLPSVVTLSPSVGVRRRPLRRR